MNSNQLWNGLISFPIMFTFHSMGKIWQGSGKITYFWMSLFSSLIFPYYIKIGIKRSHNLANNIWMKYTATHSAQISSKSSRSFFLWGRRFWITLYCELTTFRANIIIRDSLSTRVVSGIEIVLLMVMSSFQGVF